MVVISGVLPVGEQRLHVLLKPESAGSKCWVVLPRQTMAGPDMEEAAAMVF
jgi:hypothetical protein